MSRSTCRPWKAILLIALAGVPACKDVSVVAVDVVSIRLSPEQELLFSGDTLRMSVVVEDAMGNELSGRPVTWSSDDESVASVDANGLVEARSSGETRIRASAGGAVGMATIGVTAGPLIDVSESEVEFEAVEGEGGSSSEDVAISNGGGGTLEGLAIEISYESGQPGGWLEANLEGSEAPATVELLASPGELDAGEYHAELEISAESADRPRIVPVTLRVRAPSPSIGLSLSSIEFEWEEGQSLPSSRTVQITNEGGGTVEGLQASVSYGAGGEEGWLSASLEGSTAPTELTVEVRSSDLEPGRYEATVRVSASNADNSPRTLAVRLDVRQGVSPARSEISASPTEIEADGESTSTVTVQLRDPRGNALSSGGDAVTLSTSRGSLGDVEDLGDGRYRATLTASTSAGTAVVTGRVNGEEIEDDARVEFVNVKPAPSIGLSTDALDFEWEEGESPPSARTVQVTNDGGGTLSGLQLSVEYGAGGATGWLDADLDGSTAPAEITVAVQPTGSSAGDLPPGSYEANVRVSASDADDSPRTIAVRLEVRQGVSAEESEISASPAEIEADGESTSTVTVQLRDPRGDPVTSGGDAVTLATTRGSLGDVEDRGDGTYRATLTASTTAGTAVVTGAVNGETIGDDATVEFVAVEASPSIELSTTALDFEWEEGESPPSARTVQVTNAGGGSLEGLQASTEYVAGGASGWLDAALDGSTAPAQLTVTVQPTDVSSGGDLPPGSYEASVEVSAPDADDSPRTLAVRLEVLQGVSAEASEISASPAEIEADGESTSTVTVQLRDPRGDPLDSGGRAVTLATTGGSLSEVEDQGDGTYRASLTSSETPGTAVVTGEVDGAAIGDEATVEFVEPPES